MARPAEDGGLAVRRQPSQRRSQERVERIRVQARLLLNERGYDGFSLREVARRADVPIGTLYQFFPNAAALVRHLGEANIEVIDAAIGAALVPAPDDHAVDWARNALAIVRAAYAEVPAFVEIWSGMQANPASRRLDIADTVRNAGDLRDALRVQVPRLCARDREAAALAITVFVGAVERLSLQLPTEQENRLREGLTLLLDAFLRAASEPTWR